MTDDTYHYVCPTAGTVHTTTVWLRDDRATLCSFAARDVEHAIARRGHKDEPAWLLTFASGRQLVVCSCAITAARWDDLERLLGLTPPPPTADTAAEVVP